MFLGPFSPYNAYEQSTAHNYAIGTKAVSSGAALSPFVAPVSFRRFEFA